jgi:hypothetical protein
MISYKNWKSLNESFGFTTLGLAQPQNLGLTSNLPTEEELLSEMKKKMAAIKKKMKKKMDGDMGIAPDEDEGDGEMVAPAAKKDENPDADKEAAVDSEDGGDDSEVVVKGKKVVDPSGDDETPDDAGGDEDKGDDTGMAKELFMMKKKMKKDGKKDSKDKKDDKKEIKKEDADWINSVQNMLGVPQTSNWDGFSPVGEVSVAVREEPAAGEVGFAPQGKVGSL